MNRKQPAERSHLRLVTDLTSTPSTQKVSLIKEFGYEDEYQGITVLRPERLSAPLARLLHIEDERKSWLYSQCCVGEIVYLDPTLNQQRAEQVIKRMDPVRDQLAKRLPTLMLFREMFMMTFMVENASTHTKQLVRDVASEVGRIAGLSARNLINVEVADRSGVDINALMLPEPPDLPPDLRPVD